MPPTPSYSPSPQFLNKTVYQTARLHLMQILPDKGQLRRGVQVLAVSCLTGTAAHQDFWISPKTEWQNVAATMVMDLP